MARLAGLLGWCLVACWLAWLAGITDGLLVVLALLAFSRRGGRRRARWRCAALRFVAVALAAMAVATLVR